jgi:pimeloyl-ACP methyl ester carboxylesterase
VGVIFGGYIAYPKWQKFLREEQPPTLIVWGKNDPAFIVAGARAYLRDLPHAELHLLDAGHFAAEEKPAEIAKYVTDFMMKLDSGSSRGRPTDRERKDSD